MPSSKITLQYAPRTRSFTALWLLEELDVSYELESFDLSIGAHHGEDFHQLNPMGKVPVVVHDGTPISEVGAIAIYLADRFPGAGLAPAIDDPQRAAYLRWCFFASAIMEPCFGEKFFKWDLPASSVAWGSFERMMTCLTEALEQGPYLLGERFSAADILVGSNVRFGHMFGAIPNEGVTAAYVARLTEREACGRAATIERREGERFPPKK